MSQEKFRDLLDQTYQWPDFYEFKFIVKTQEKQQVVTLLIGYTITETASAKGNYTSINARKLMKSTQEVLDVYELISKIKGVISL